MQIFRHLSIQTAHRSSLRRRHRSPLVPQLWHIRRVWPTCTTLANRVVLFFVAMLSAFVTIIGSYDTFKPVYIFNFVSLAHYQRKQSKFKHSIKILRKKIKVFHIKLYLISFRKRNNYICIMYSQFQTLHVCYTVHRLRNCALKVIII